MTEHEVLCVFAARFVIESFRDRFVHEALKKPRKLHERICHQIQDVFNESFKGGVCQFEPNESCWVFSSVKSMKETTWQSASKLVGLGDGVLVIGSAGNKFYAETEAGPGGSIVYASGANPSFNGTPGGAR